MMSGLIVDRIGDRIFNDICNYAMQWSDGDPLEMEVCIDDDSLTEADEAGREYYHVAHGKVYFEEAGVYRDIPNYGLEPLFIGQPNPVDIDVTIERWSKDDDNVLCDTRRITDMMEIWP